MNRIQLIPINKKVSKIIINSQSVGVLSDKKLSNILGSSGADFISDVELEKLINEIEDNAWNKLLNYLARRDYSELEIKLYLKKQALSDDMIQKLIGRAKKYNYINDERFAEMYALSLYENQKSRNYAYHKLREKGIGEEIIEKMLDKFGFDDEKRLEKIVKKVLKKYDDLSQKIRYEKTLSYLVRNGFEYEKIKDEVYKNIFV